MLPAAIRRILTDRNHDGAARELQRSLAPAAALIASLSLTACAAVPAGSPEAIKAHVAYLASDALEGREPGTSGYGEAADYVVAAFRKAGLKPGADGAWFQNVPLVMTERELAGAEFEMIAPSGERRKLAYLEDYVAGKPLDREVFAVEGAAVFAGYGVIDADTGYDDYGSIDVRGKIAVVFSGAPKSFEGAKRAYLGESDFKKANAAARGAIGLITLPTRQSEATSPWERAVERAHSPEAAYVGPNGLAHV
ncbi:MAG: hypothetical protein ABL957_03400, partial [Parvularculaceae bacterium]